MKDMKVEVKLLTYPLLSKELSEFTTFLVMRTSPSTLLLHAPQLPASQIASLCTSAYHSAVLTMKTFLQFIVHPTQAPHYHCIPSHFDKSPAKSIYTICDDLEEEEEQDFQTATLDDDHWIIDPVSDRCLCIHEHLQPHSLCCYPCPYMDYTPALYQDTLDLSDISDFKDVMTTSSDEDIPALDNVIGLWNLWTTVSIKTFT